MGYHQKKYKYSVRPKKQLGQHFLTDKEVAMNIVNALLLKDTEHVIEIGPGMGVLSELMIANQGINEIDYSLVELDRESVEFLNKTNLYDRTGVNIIHKDILSMDWKDFGDEISLIGNLPYNISSPIFFKILEHWERIRCGVFMIQKEVGERICSNHGTKKFGILSVLLQTYFECEYLFTVPPVCFKPPPKVESAVIRLKALEERNIDTPFKELKILVKKSFNQRRKMLRNSLKSELELLGKDFEKFKTLRPEQLSVNEFQNLALAYSKKIDAI